MPGRFGPTASLPGAVDEPGDADADGGERLTEAGADLGDDADHGVEERVGAAWRGAASLVADTPSGFVDRDREHLRAADVHAHDSAMKAGEATAGVGQ